MNNIAVFTESIALELITRGFKLSYTTKYAWLFEDSSEIEAAISELVENI